MKDDRVYLVHIMERIARIDTYREGGRESFMNDTMVQDAVMHNLEIIGEAASNVSLEFRRAHPEVMWRRAINLRNVLIHNYVGVELTAFGPTYRKRSQNSKPKSPSSKPPSQTSQPPDAIANTRTPASRLSTPDSRLQNPIDTHLPGCYTGGAVGGAAGN